MIIGIPTVLLLAHLLIAVALVVNLLKRRFDPWAMAFWTVCIVFIPFLGALAYVLLSEDRIARRAERRFGGRAAPEPALKGRTTDLELDSIPPNWRSVADIAERIAPTHLTVENGINIMDNSEQIFGTWRRAIEDAKHHVHMLYFTFRSDETGREFRDILVRKAREGVQCRVLLDSVGSHTLTGSFWNPLREAGGEVAFFMPVAHFQRRWSIHLRNHRKLIVVDGRVGFMGSQNIDDDSRGRNPKYGRWADVCLQMDGASVGELQRVFVEDWAFATDEVLGDGTLFESNGAVGSTPIQIIPTGPDQKERIIERILLEAFLQAEQDILIATPYFVPSDIFLTGLMRARLRNVRVRIVLPSVTDMPIVLHAGRSYYPELIEEGVEIYEFADGMLHSKVVAVDNSWAMTGSANMDLRSFRMNFEILGLVYDPEIVRGFTQILEGYCGRSDRIALDQVHGKKLRTQLLEGAARLFSPQL